MYREHVYIHSHTKTFLWVSYLPHMYIHAVSHLGTEEHASPTVAEVTSVTLGVFVHHYPLVSRVFLSESTLLGPYPSSLSYHKQARLKVSLLFLIQLWLDAGRVNLSISY